MRRRGCASNRMPPLWQTSIAVAGTRYTHQGAISRVLEFVHKGQLAAALTDLGSENSFALPHLYGMNSTDVDEDRPGKGGPDLSA